ncbi:GTP-binding protein HSR1-related [Aminomonas paucivorans DSM 12260]|uniref:GTP-binding protein HSR1-related n=1 Tax=Aminomonas paucivorans DSM 12260 TaxID=584708 RepID=E3D0J4_9BACT|nr:GTPase [Aminomonas paucivorans]EFQ23013.1 GTP-binding protein HSR1-related [Aminomonas paucivorans DSM 12260]
MATEKFELYQWTTIGNDLLFRSRQCLATAPSEKIQMLSGRVPTEVCSSGKSVNLVFAGQYSAGKSSIMKVLTGREDIAIGAGITTEKTHTYDWGGITVVDTPGVHTQLRPDHDEITYRAIADADLLVFVVTNELFDSHLAKHFRNLAIERDKAHEMMLVVNKMRRCAKGNSQEAQNVIREDLRKVLAPFTPEDLRTTFIDAEAALESKTETDGEIAKILLKKSGVDGLTHELNRFVREKGLSSRYTTALYSLEQILQEALASESTGDKDIDALEELLLQRRRALLDTQDRIPRAVEGEIQNASSQIRQEGRKVADMINGSADQKAVDQELQAAQDRVQNLAEQLEKSVQVVIGKHMKALDDRVGDIANSELAKELLPRLVHRIKQASISPEAMKNLKKASDISSRLGEFLVRNSFTPKTGTLGGLFKLNQYSGTATHGAVKAIGKFFGKSFKPWEAVKWTRTVANVGRVFAVAGTVLTFVLQIKEDADAAQLEVDLRESRSAVRSGFNDAAHVIEMHFDKATQSFVSSAISSEIENVDSQLNELRNLQQTRSDLFQNLLGLLEETRELIKSIHSTESESVS